MKTLKGINLDVRPLDQPKETYRFGKNGILNHIDGTIMNEEGFKLIAEIAEGYKNAGHILLQTEVLLFFVSEKKEKFMLLSLNTDNNSVDVILEMDNIIELDYDKPIHGFYYIDYKLKTFIVFTDGDKPIRHLNYSLYKEDKSKKPLLDDFEYMAIDDSPVLKGHKINSTGKLYFGDYYFYIQYGKEDGSYSQFYIINNSSIVVSREGGQATDRSNKSIELLVGNIDTSYEYVNIAVLRFYNDKIDAVQFLSKYYIDKNNTKKELGVSFTGFETDIKMLTFAEINTQHSLYKKAKVIGLLNGASVVANTEEFSFDLEVGQDIANSIEIKPVEANVTAMYLLSQSEKASCVYASNGEWGFKFKEYMSKPGFWAGEVYTFYFNIVIGGKTYTYHIPIPEYINDLCTTILTEETIGENKTPVRYIKLKEFEEICPKRASFDYSVHVRKTYYFQFNIKDSLNLEKYKEDFPVLNKGKCFISYAKKTTGNSLILGQGLFIPCKTVKTSRNSDLAYNDKKVFSPLFLQFKHQENSGNKFEGNDIRFFNDYTLFKTHILDITGANGNIENINNLKSVKAVATFRIANMREFYREGDSASDERHNNYLFIFDLVQKKLHNPKGFHQKVYLNPEKIPKEININAGKSVYIKNNANYANEIYNHFTNAGLFLSLNGEWVCDAYTKNDAGEYVNDTHLGGFMMIYSGDFESLSPKVSERDGNENGFLYYDFFNVEISIFNVLSNVDEKKCFYPIASQQKAICSDEFLFKDFIDKKYYDFNNIKKVLFGDTYCIPLVQNMVGVLNPCQNYVEKTPVKNSTMNCLYRYWVETKINYFKGDEKNTLPLWKNKYVTMPDLRNRNIILNVQDDIRTGKEILSPNYTISAATGDDNDVISGLQYFHLKEVENDLFAGNVFNSGTPKFNYRGNPDLSFSEFINTKIKKQTIFPFRVHKSAKQLNNTSKTIKVFKPLDFTDITSQFGHVTNIVSFKDVLFIHLERALLRTQDKTQLNANSTEASITLGTGDLFAFDPVEVSPSQLGIGGIANRISSVFCEAGYIFLDASVGVIYHFDGTALKSLNNGLNSFLKKYLQNRETSVIFGYDKKYNRLLVTCQDVNNAFTISYSFKMQAWAFFHDYIPDYYISTRNALYGIKDKKLMLFNAGTDYGKYFDDKQHKFFVDICLSNPTNIILEAVYWITECLNSENVVVNNDTLTGIYVWNSYQHTGFINIKEIFSKKQFYGRDIAGTWSYNELRNILKDKKWETPADFIEDAFKNFDIKPAYIIQNQNWYDKDFLQDKYMIIRLEYDNITNNRLFLQDIAVSASLSDR